MLSIKMPSHSVQVYDTVSTSTRLSTLSIGSKLSLVRERVTHPCLAESKMSGRDTEDSWSFGLTPGTSRRPDKQFNELR